MNYIFKGSLCGHLCEDCIEPLYGMEVVLYLPWQKERVLENAVASTKETFHVVTKEEAAERQKLIISTAKTDDKGNFEFSLDEKYRNTAFDIDFICGTVPRTPPKPPRKEPVQIHLTTVYPQWRISKEEESYFFKWEYCISTKWWCYIRGYYFDAWVICGHMYVCGTKTPIPNVKITAWDADFLTDDNLGNDTTDANGHFRIDYSSIDFKQTFLSPWINVETDLGTLTFNSGPDVYFKYEYNGVAIQGETSADRRNNVGYCLCVDLCLEDLVIIPDPIPASFTKIGNNGNHFISEFIASGNSNVIASTTGKTPAGQAFYSCINLRGNLSQKLNGVAMEYSFDTIETTGPGGAEIGVWKKVLAPQMCDAVIGTFFTLTGDPMNPIIIVDYTVGVSNGVDASGWIAVPQSSNFAPNINGVILGFDTSSLNSNSVNMAGLIQGQSTTTIVPLQQNRFFKIRMRKRQVGIPHNEVTAGESNPIAMFNTVYNNVPKFGSWMPLPGIDERGVACIDIQEMIGGGTDCTPITNAIHVNYTAANPNMGGVSLKLYGPGGPYTIENVSPASLVDETFETATELHTIPPPPSVLVPVGSLAKCAYTVKFSVELKLTNGESQHGNIEDWMSFCKS